MYFGPPTNLTLNGRSYFLVNGTLRTALAILAVWRNWSNSTKHLELAQKHFHWNEIPCLTKRRKLFPLFHIQWVGTFMEFYEHFTLDQNSLSYSFQKVEGSAYIHMLIYSYIGWTNYMGFPRKSWVTAYMRFGGCYTLTSVHRYHYAKKIRLCLLGSRILQIWKVFVLFLYT